MSKILAGYVLAVAAAHEAAYDREASDKATEDARIRTREKLKQQATEKAFVIADVTAKELMDHRPSPRIHIDGEKHLVTRCFSDVNGTTCADNKNGTHFRTENGFVGELKYVRRRGRGLIYDAPAQITEQQVEIAIDEFIDYAQFQRKTLWQVAEEIVPVLYRQPVYLLLQTAWNDSLGWANEVMALRDHDGEDTHNFRFLIPNAKGGEIDYQLSAQNELAAAFKLGQLFHEDLSIETIKLNMLPE